MNTSFEQLLGRYQDETGEKDWRSIPELKDAIESL